MCEILDLCCLETLPQLLRPLGCCITNWNPHKVTKAALSPVCEYTYVILCVLIGSYWFVFVECLRVLEYLRSVKAAPLPHHLHVTVVLVNALQVGVD